jgi:hypothetical protein
MVQDSGSLLSVRIGEQMTDHLGKRRGCVRPESPGNPGGEMILRSIVRNVIKISFRVCGISCASRVLLQHS